MNSFREYAALNFNRYIENITDIEDSKEDDSETTRVYYQVDLIPIDTLLYYNTSPIDRPLLNLRPLLYNISVYVNKLIHLLSNYSNMSKRQYSIIIKEILSIGCNTGMLFPEFRDEIICQIVKQSNHSTFLIVKIALDILLCCTVCFQPSIRLKKYIQHYLLNQFTSIKYSELCKTISHILSNMDLNLPRRNLPPSMDEIKSILNNDFIHIQILLSNGECFEIPVNEQTTVGQLILQIRYHLAIDESKYDDDFIITIETSKGKMINISKLLNKNRFLIHELLCENYHENIESYYRDNVNDYDSKIFELTTLVDNQCFEPIISFDENLNFMNDRIELLKYQMTHSLSSTDIILIPQEYSPIKRYLFHKQLRFEIWLFPLVKEKTETSMPNECKMDIDSDIFAQNSHLYESIAWPTNLVVFELLFHQVVNTFKDDLAVLSEPNTVLKTGGLMCRILFDIGLRDGEVENSNAYYEKCIQDTILNNLEKLVSLSLIDMDKFECCICKQSLEKDDQLYGFIESVDDTILADRILDDQSPSKFSWQEILATEIYHYWNNCYRNITRRDAMIKYLSHAIQFPRFGNIAFPLTSFENCLVNHLVNPVEKHSENEYLKARGMIQISDLTESTRIVVKDNRLSSRYSSTNLSIQIDQFGVTIVEEIPSINRKYCSKHQRILTETNAILPKQCKNSSCTDLDIRIFKLRPNYFKRLLTSSIGSTITDSKQRRLRNFNALANDTKNKINSITEQHGYDKVVRKVMSQFKFDQIITWSYKQTTLTIQYNSRKLTENFSCLDDSQKNDYTESVKFCTIIETNP